MKLHLKDIVLIAIVLYLSIILIHSLMYNDETYNCIHMARDMEHILESMPIDVKIVHGFNNNTDDFKHLWIKVFNIDIDSTTLLPFINNVLYDTSVEYDSFNAWTDR